MKSVLAMILLTGVIMMNTAMFCKSLCLTDRHKDMSPSHTAHHQDNKMPEHKMPNGEMCPAAHTGHGTHHPMPDASIKCGCSADDNASSISEMALIKSPGDLMPYVQVISKIDLFNPIFSSREPIPLEAPPNLLS